MSDINDVKCRACKAQPGDPCTTPKGDLANEPHKARVDAYWANPPITGFQRGLVDHVKAHALRHYNDGGWDVIVETYSDHDILNAIGRARTKDGAINKMWPIVKGLREVFDDRMADAENSAF